MGYNNPDNYYRILSERRKKRNIKKGFNTRLLKIYKELEKLHEQIDNLGYAPLDPPVQKGWIRKFDLREDVKRSKNADLYQFILGFINTENFCIRKDFKVKKRKYGRKIFIVQEQTLKNICECEWEKLKSDPRISKLFFIEEYTDFRGNTCYHYVFSEPWRYRLKVTPNIITRVKVTDYELENRIGEINRYLDVNNYQIKIQKLLYGKIRYKGWHLGEKTRHRNPLKNLALYRIQEELY